MTIDLVHRDTEPSSKIDVVGTRTLTALETDDSVTNNTNQRLRPYDDMAFADGALRAVEPGNDGAMRERIVVGRAHGLKDIMVSDELLDDGRDPKPFFS